MKLIGSLVCCLFFSITLFAQDDEEPSVVFSTKDYSIDEEEITPLSVKPDYSGENVDVKPFDKDQWKKVVGDVDYTENLKKPKRQQGNGSGDGTNSGKRGDTSGADDDSEGSGSFSLPTWSGGPLQLLSYIIIVAIIALILYLIIKNIPTQSFSAEGKIKQDHENIENIEDLDVDNLLKKALAEGNYRLAIRLYYLALLKTLHEKQLIRWEKDKTNKEYLSELIERDDLYNEVKTLTLTYEKIWYGDYIIGNEIVTETYSGFERVQRKILTVSQ